MIAEHKRDRSTDADLKRDINVNSLILNTSNILDDDGTFIATTEIHKHEPDNDLIMMMPNDTNLSQNNLDTTNRSNFTLLGTSIDDLILNNTKINSKTLLSKHSKNRKLIDVLKAAEGDIIFGNNNTNRCLNEKKKIRTISSKNSNKASKTLGSNRHESINDGDLTQQNISCSNNRLGASNDSLNSVKINILEKNFQKDKTLNNKSLNQSYCVGEKIIKKSKKNTLDMVQ